MQISIKHTQKTQSTENTNTMVAPEAGPVVDPVVGGELVDQVHRLGARRALGRRPLERHRFSSCPNQRGNLKNEQRIPYTSAGGRWEVRGTVARQKGRKKRKRSGAENRGGTSKWRREKEKDNY
ncbi:hypothetical protein B296_00037201 [Ensete ventricosum]|uniref:Uncharacterized protein n=1 Tax=Ensete ventricosum TaxID=4639 RepID=A0A427A079_ENSVE|nr:hypothetical protein B296_00037201 [Ensete ventricosum]